MEALAEALIYAVEYIDWLPDLHENQLDETVRPTVAALAESPFQVKLEAVAEALVHAVTYIDWVPDPDEEHLHEDAQAFEFIAAILADTTDAEKNALAAAAQRAFQAEQAGAKREYFQQSYGRWMEEMFVYGWDGNKRTDSD
ncbi:MAG TPA: hypothetical protein VF278_21740 [Pirellulales bacterium]